MVFVNLLVVQMALVRRFGFIAVGEQCCTVGGFSSVVLSGVARGVGEANGFRGIGGCAGGSFEGGGGGNARAPVFGSSEVWREGWIIWLGC